MKFIHQIEAYCPGNPQEEADKKFILDCLRHQPENHLPGIPDGPYDGVGMGRQ